MYQGNECTAPSNMRSALRFACLIPRKWNLKHMKSVFLIINMDALENKKELFIQVEY